MSDLQTLIEELHANTDQQDFCPQKYSGRGMYGRECLGVVVDNLLTGLQAIAHEAGKRGIEMPEDVHSDSMGRGAILYWPREVFCTTRTWVCAHCQYMHYGLLAPKICPECDAGDPTNVVLADWHKGATE